MIHERPPDRAQGGHMPTAYEKDVVLWSEEQAHYLRSGQFDKLDLENLAEEVLDVGKSEIRALESHMAQLLLHLLKWAYQPSRQSRSWSDSIHHHRKQVLRSLRITPSLRHKMTEDTFGFWESVWDTAKHGAAKETGLDGDSFPSIMPWSEEDILTEGWLPDTAV